MQSSQDSPQNSGPSLPQGLGATNNQDSHPNPTDQDQSQQGQSIDTLEEQPAQQQNTSQQTLKRKRTDDEVSPWIGATTILVGPGEVCFMIPTKLVRQDPLFHKILDSGMLESHTGIIRLPEQDPKTFAHIHRFLLQKKFLFDMNFIVSKANGSLFPDEEDEADEHDENVDEDSAMEQLIAIYKFADMTMFEELQNNCMDQIGQYYRFNEPDTELLEQMLDRREGVMLRDLALFHVCVSIMRYGWEDFTRSQTYKEFFSKDIRHVESLVDRMARFREATDHILECPADNVERCQFHKHVDTAPCDDGYLLGVKSEMFKGGFHRGF